MSFSASRFILSILFSAQSLAAATSWYVAKEATGSNNGTSWANAWNEMDQVVWASINPGDTLWLSGGPLGGTNNYFTSLNHNIGSPNNGTPSNPITIKSATDSSHNGLVKLIGAGIYLFRDFYIVDGSKSPWVPDTILDTYRVGTNCNIEVNQTNQTHACFFAFFNACKLKWVHVSAAGVRYDSGQDYDAISIGNYSNGTEIAYCWLTDAYGMALEAYNPKQPTSPATASSFGQMTFHHNLCERIHDNYAQTDGGVDFHHNVMRYFVLPSVIHPDGFQGIEQCVRIWNNIMLDPLEQFLYFECNDTDGTGMHDIYVWNNVFGCITNGTQMVIITGHDAEPETVSLSITNVWFANNTWIANSGAAVWSWNCGATRTSGVVSNINFINEFIWTVAPNNTVPVLQFYTNAVLENNQTGFTYNKADVRVDYNNISGGSGNGKGIFYGPTGDYNANTPYADMAAFSSAIGYNSNNNLTATMVSVSNLDFRIGADKALKGYGTNLTSLTNLMTGINFDIIGNARPASGAWDIGAYQSDPTLMVWLSLNNWYGSTNILDDSGYTNNGILYSSATNWPTSTNANGSLAAASMLGPWGWPGPQAEIAGSVQYFAITNLYGITTLSNGTVAIRADYGSNSMSVSALFDTGYYNQPGSWNLGRYNSYYTIFSVWTNNVQWTVFGFPDDTEHLTPQFDTKGWHHYAVTWDGSNFVGYYDGVPFGTNSMAGVGSLKVSTSDARWLAIGTWKNAFGPLLDPNRPANAGGVNPPNCCWFGGLMDDIRIYNRALSAVDIANIAKDQGTSAPNSQPANFAATVTVGGGVRIGGGASITR